MNPPRPKTDAPSLLPPVSTARGDGFQVTLRWDGRTSGTESDCCSFEIELQVAQDAYAHASSELAYAPIFPEEYAGFVRQGPMEPVRQLAHLLREQSQQRGYSPLQEVENVVRLVRGLRYWSDTGQHRADDQPKYPVQTLVDGGGDCEDFAILAAAILWSLEHPVALLYLETDSTAHMAVGYQTGDMEDGFAVNGSDGQRYVYIETVPTEAALGEVSDELRYGLRRVVAVPL